MNPTVRCVVHPASAWSDLVDQWEQLVSARQDASFFLSPLWIETWLDIYLKDSASLQGHLLCFCEGTTTIGMCLLVARRSRRGPIPIRQLFLNTAGEQDSESVCVEYNDVLCLPGYELAVSNALAAELARWRWDEFVINGGNSTGAVAILEEVLSSCRFSRRSEPSYYVSLSALRARQISYLESLRQPIRKHAKQYLRYCTELGPVRVHAAEDSEEAITMLEQLRALHQTRWEAKGHAGAFGSEAFVQFHQQLIRRAFGSGFIQLLRITAGDTLIGLTYAFVFRDKVYFYQCGIDYSLPTRLSPGIVCNVSAIQYAADHGFAEYDFLSGDAQYKRTLSSDHRELAWVVAERKGWRNSLILRLRALKGRLSPTS